MLLRAPRVSLTGRWQADSCPFLQQAVSSKLCPGRGRRARCPARQVSLLPALLPSGKGILGLVSAAARSDGPAVPVAFHHSTHCITSGPHTRWPETVNIPLARESTVGQLLLVVLVWTHLSGRWAPVVAFSHTSCPLAGSGGTQGAG